VGGRGRAPPEHLDWTLPKASSRSMRADRMRAARGTRRDGLQLPSRQVRRSGRVPRPPGRPKVVSYWLMQPVDAASSRLPKWTSLFGRRLPTPSDCSATHTTRPARIDRESPSGRVLATRRHLRERVQQAYADASEHEPGRVDAPPQEQAETQDGREDGQPVDQARPPSCTVTPAIRAMAATLTRREPKRST